MTLLAIVGFIACCAVLGRTLGPFALLLVRCLGPRLCSSGLIAANWARGQTTRLSGRPRLDPRTERGATTLETVLVVLLIVFLVLLILRVA